MEPDDILHLEAQEFIRQSSDEMLELASLQEIDLTALANRELRTRRQRPYVSALVRELLR
jgi:hypothetical protein